MNPYPPGTERHALLQKILDEQCPYLAAERAGVAQYGTDPKTGWITAASLQEGPHTPSEWTLVVRATYAKAKGTE